MAIHNLIEFGIIDENRNGESEFKPSQKKRTFHFIEWLRDVEINAKSTVEYSEMFQELADTFFVGDRNKLGARMDHHLYFMQIKSFKVLFLTSFIKNSVFEIL